MRYLPLMLCLLCIAACERPTSAPSGPALTDVIGQRDTDDLAGYARALQPRQFAFPRDHSAHPAFKNEWWYLTGNLTTTEGLRLGYQVTFFRFALAPEPVPAQEPRESQWATRQVWMAHAAVTQIATGKHLQEERFARGAAGLAGNTARPFRVWLDDWQLTGTDGGFPWHIDVRAETFALDLELSPLKDIVLQGERGLSQKSSAPGNASYYYSATRLQTGGTVRVDGQTDTVTGLSWLDREWGTSALGSQQVGWDWFSLQFDTGGELMYYQLRRRDGSVDRHSRGSRLSAANRLRSLMPDDILLEPLAYWRSDTGARYPVRWRMRLVDDNTEWIVQAPVEDQLMALTFSYWEGTVDILDPRTGESLGRGYLEMTGY